MPAIEPYHQYLSRFEAEARQARDHHSALTRDSTTHGTQRQNPVDRRDPSGWPMRPVRGRGPLLVRLRGAESEGCKSPPGRRLLPET